MQAFLGSMVRSGIRRGSWWRLGTDAALATLLVATLLAGSRTAGAAANAANGVSGAGKTIIEGGTGGTPLSPVTTLVAFHANAQGGDFECLALVSSQTTGPGSGDFAVNAMYVTGKVTSLDVQGNTATLKGTATVTGLGAGTGQAFTAQVTGGGPGTTVTLQVSGMTFHEILVEGQINVH